MTHNRLACFVLGFGVAVLFYGAPINPQQTSGATVPANGLETGR